VSKPRDALGQLGVADPLIAVHHRRVTGLVLRGRQDDLCQRPGLGAGTHLD
jgi:hypothetical protein